MNWEALGAISETLAAIGVIVSLLYLAKQIRISSHQTEQNSNVVRGTAYQQFRQQVNAVQALRVSDPTLTEIWIKGSQDFTSLTEVEQHRLGGLYFMMTGNWESLFYLRESGVFDERMGADRKMVLESPGYRHWWSNRRNAYSKEFRDHIEEGMGGDA